ncbi:MAG: redox-sensing transcriptional repressor Rex [Clostridia bacterium]|nr:redox-sensing transcriptional repressor Rex [Clostridia bacterium]
MKDNKISMAVIRRLPKYHRYLSQLMDRDINRISSKELSKIIGFSASQIRQDLNNFGGFGQQGYGYNVEALYREIGKILGLDREYKTVIIGAGNLGQALANYTNFSRFGYKLQAMFDVNPRLMGLRINDVEVKDVDLLGDYVRENNIDIAYVCTNRSSAQQIADILCKNGIKAVWNFTPVDLVLKKGAVVENIHLIENLFTLSYFLKENE